MIQLQKAIRNVIQNELNKNNQGLFFEVSLYNVKTNSFLENEIPLNDTYALERKRFIPVVIEEIGGEYADLQNLTAVEAYINMSFLIPTDETDFNNMAVDETFEKVSIALDDFRQKTLANNLPLGESKYIVGNDYKIKILNDTKTFSSDFISFDCEFVNYQNGNLLSDEIDFTVETLDGEIVFTKESETFSFPYELNKQYVIRVESENSGTNMNVEVRDGFSVNSETLTNITYNLKDLVFGGNFFKTTDLRIGSSPSSSNIVLIINDFKTLEPTQGEEDSFEILSSDEVQKIGSLGNVVFGFSISNPTSNQFTMANGMNYQQFELSLSSFVSDSVFVGNQVKYFLDEHEIFPIYRDESYASETDPSQVVGQQITKHTATQTALSREYTIYYKYDKKLNELVEKIVSEEPLPNEVYTLKVKYPLVTKEYKVIITQGGLGITNNTPISISVKLDLASNILLPSE